MCMEAGTFGVRRALPTSCLFVGEGAGSFSKVKFDQTELGSVLGWRRTHSFVEKFTNYQSWQQEPVKQSREIVLLGIRLL